MTTNLAHGLFAGLWLAIAGWQSHRGFVACSASSGWATVFWLIHVGVLFMPIVAVRLIARPGPVMRRRAFDPTLALIVLTYVSIVVSMRLLETCTTGR